jgi:S1-C subfamily serine protease
LNARGEVVGMIAGIPFSDWTSTPFNMLPPGAPAGGPGSQRGGGVISAAVQPGQSKTEPGATAPPSGVPVPDKVVFLRPPVTSAGFAVPIDDIKPVLAGLRQGKFQHCWLGVDMKEERKPIEKDGAVTWRRSVYVSTVYPGSPASAAGLQVGDVLTSVNGRSVNRINIVRATLLRARPGDAMEVRVERKTGAQTISARLAAKPEAAAPVVSGKH